VRNRGTKIGLLVMALGLAAWLQFGRNTTQREPLPLHFGATAAEVREVELHFAREGAPAGDLVLAFPDGAPVDVEREARLRPGAWQVGVRLVYQRAGQRREWHASRQFTAGARDAIDLEIPR
jgi:hypothetical protein